MDILGFIVWDVDPTLFTIPGLEREVRYYGLSWALALFVSQYVMSVVFKKEGKSEKELESLSWHVIIASIVGARLGHCFFYDFDYYVLENPIRILYIWEGGLASHGGAAGILIGLYLYTKKFTTTYIWALDRIVIVAALSAFFIRMGNLMNSEIVGLVTDVPWAFKFVLNDCPPPNVCDIADIPARHPSQLYEAVSSLLLFSLLMFLYLKTSIKEHSGKLFGVFLIIMFTLRFLYEYLKENQSDFEDGLLLNMGQTLSIPFVLVGLYFLFRPQKTTSKS